MKVINKKQVHHCLSQFDTSNLLESMAQAFFSYSKGLTDSPHRVTLNWDNAKALMMPSTVQGACETIKVVGMAKDANGLKSSTLVLDHENGKLQYILNSEDLTAARTASGSALATLHCAKPDSKVMVLVGAGLQAYYHAKLILSLFESIEQVYIFNRNIQSGEKLVNELNVINSNIKYEVNTLDIPSNADNVSPKVKNILSQADIICSCIPSLQPFLFSKYIKLGCHINCVGSYTEQMHEFDTEVILNSNILVDSKVGIETEAGEFMLANKQGVSFKFTEIGNVIINKNNTFKVDKKLLNENFDVNKKFTLFKSVGLAAQDTIISKKVCELAEQFNAYTEILDF